MDFAIARDSHNTTSGVPKGVTWGQTTTGNHTSFFGAEV